LKEKIHPDDLYRQAMDSWVIRSCLLRQESRIRSYGTKKSAHAPFLNMSWVEAAVQSVYTGYVLLDDGLKPRHSSLYKFFKNTGYQEITFGSDPEYRVKNRSKLFLPDNYGLGQTLYGDVCHYNKLRRLNVDSIEAYGSGMVQYKTAAQLTADEQKVCKNEFEKNGTAHVAFTDKATDIMIHQIKCDWEGVKLELEECRLAIEQSLWGADSRKNATLVAETEQAQGMQGVVAAMFDKQVINVARQLFDINLEFTNKVDSLEDLENLSTSVNVSDQAVKEVTGQSGLVEEV
jgi:hypothetical protein